MVAILAIKRGIFREPVLQQDLQVGTKLAKKKKNLLARILLFAFWGVTPIPKYRLFNSVENQRIGRTLKQKKTALTSS